MSKKEKVLFVVNSAAFFISHRLPIALACLDEDFEVHLACPVDANVTEIRAVGIIHHQISLDRSGQNLIREVSTIISLARIIWQVRPRIIHLITIKPIVYGGILARFFGLRSVVFSAPIIDGAKR